MNLRNSIAIIVLVFSTTTFAQSNLLNAKTPDQIGKKTQAELSADNDKPLPYGYVHDRDILMGKRIWEIIDLDERVNFPLYFPIDELTPDRRPLFNVLLSAIREGKITEVYDSSYFTTKKTLKDVEESLFATRISEAGKQVINEDKEAYDSGKKVLDEEYIIKEEITAEKVLSYEIVGYWYFDKRQGEF